MKASPSNEAYEGGDLIITFSYELLLYEDAKITTRTIIKVAREIDEYIGYAIEQNNKKHLQA